MKKIINVSLIAIAFITVLSISTIVKAQQNNNIAYQNSQKTIDYALPYPGILPGSFLYPVKTLRDKIVYFFINDPSRKAEFLLLMSDKRVNTAKYLTDNKKYDLVPGTLSEGQKYFSDMLNILKDQNGKGREIKPTLDKSEKAAQKYDEVFLELIKNSPDKYKPSLRNFLEENKKFLNEINKIKKTK